MQNLEELSTAKEIDPEWLPAAKPDTQVLGFQSMPLAKALLASLIVYWLIN